MGRRVLDYCCKVAVILIVYSLAVLSQSNEISSVVVTAAYRYMYLDTESKQYAIDNLLATVNPIIIFGDAYSISKLRKRWPQITNYRIYIERNIIDFVSYQYLLGFSAEPVSLTDNESVTLLSIEKYFMLCHAIYADSLLKRPISAPTYSWVSIDCMTSPRHVTLSAGFPDSRKLFTNSVKISVTSVSIPGSDIAWLSDKIIVGGTISWNLLRSSALSLLNETHAYSRDINTAMAYWESRLRTSYKDKTFSISQDMKENLFVNLLYTQSNLICVVRGHNIALYDHLIDESFYLAYYFSYYFPAESIGVGFICK